MPVRCDYMIMINANCRYGIWLMVTEDTQLTSLFGYPINQTIQTLVIEPPVAFVSTITNLNYSTINFVLPLQIDMAIRFNHDLKVESWDATLSWGYSNLSSWLTYTFPLDLGDCLVRSFLTCIGIFIDIPFEQRPSNTYYRSLRLK